jgi:hypothetical protein
VEWGGDGPGKPRKFSWAMIAVAAIILLVLYFAQR